VTGPARLVAAAQRLAPGATLVISRAASPQLLQLALEHSAVTAPTLRGATVWSAADTAGPVVAVVEDPNWLGCAEATPAGPFVAVSAVEPGRRWSERTRAARKLAGTLAQISGVWALPAGSAPWFAMSTPTAAERIAAAAGSAGLFGVTVLGHRFPDVPGGVRISLPDPVPAGWEAACVASVRRAIDEETGRS